MQEVNSSMVSREGITACLHLPQHDGLQDRLLNMQQRGRRSMWWAAEKEYSYERILWWIKSLIRLGCPRTSNLASLCWFGQVQVFLKYCVIPASPEDALDRWWHLSGSEAPLVRPRRTTANSSLDLSCVGVWSHWARGERLWQIHRGWYVKKSLRGPPWVHPFLDTLPSSVTPPGSEETTVRSTSSQPRSTELQEQCPCPLFTWYWSH